MEGLLHPVGPEAERVYWIRRAVALAALVVLLLLMGLLIAGLGRAAAPDRAPAAGPTPAPVVNMAPAGGPGSSQVVAQEAVPLPSANQSSPAPAPAPAATAIPPEPANTFHLTPPATAPVSAGAPTQVCDPRSVRVGLAGPQRVQAGVPVMFRISLTNAGDRDCVMAVDEKSFDLRIYSGSDRIWSSRDCVVGMPPRGATLAKDRTLEWELEWRANRSAPQCRNGTEPMGSGTYVATAELADAKPAQVVMQLRA